MTAAEKRLRATNVIVSVVTNFVERYEIAPREEQILFLAVTQTTDRRKLAKHLRLSPETIKFYIRRLLKRTGWRSLMHGVERVLREALYSTCDRAKW